jgi:hypothetical protein
LTEPVDDREEAPDQIRSAREIAVRALALFGVVGIGLEAPRDDVVTWLKEAGLWDDLSPRELRLVEAAAPTEQMMIDAGWRSEALIMLLWALGKLSELPPADKECKPGIFKDILPPFAEISEEEFATTATRRPDAELLDMAEDCMNLHAECYQAERQGRPPRKPVDAGVIRERHHAINWVIGYEGLAWDNVTTDR